MSRLLICKDAEQNTLLETRVLNETDNIKYYIIENAPTIEEREGEIGKYALDESGQVIVIYEVKPKSKDEELQEQINDLQDIVMTLANTVTGGDVLW